MLSRKFLLATAGVFFCLSSFVSGQDLSFLQNKTDYFTAANSRSAAVSSLPSGVLQSDTAAKAVSSDGEEISAAHQADFLVLLGLGGVLVASFSFAGIIWFTQKRSQSRKKPVTLVGV